MYRENLADFVNLCRLERVPLTTDAQDRLLRAIRYTLFNRKYDELQSLFMACGMGESEIIARKRFYLKFAALVGRLTLLMPPLHKFFMLDYVAEDMIDGGDPDLVAAGTRLQTILSHAKSGAADIKGQIIMPAITAFQAERLAFYQKNPAEFIVDFIEPYWEYDSDRFYGLAAAVEFLSLDAADRLEVGPILIKSLGEFASPGDFFAAFNATTVNLLKKSGYADWADLFLQFFKPLEAVLAVKETYSPPEQPVKTPLVAEDAYGELSLAAISNVWKTKGLDEALGLAKQRLQMTPDDPFACGMLGDMFLTRMNVPLALACLSRAFHRAPDAPVVVFTLARAFLAGYFSEQVDLCRQCLQKMPAYQAAPQNFMFGVELFLKCDEPGARVAVNGRELGECPLQIRNVRPGSAQLAWKLKDGREKIHQVDLVDATVAKFKYHPVAGIISDEISRDGSITVYTPTGARELRDMIPEFLVADLKMLPDPTIAQCLAG